MISNSWIRVCLLVFLISSGAVQVHAQFLDTSVQPASSTTGVVTTSISSPQLAQLAAATGPVAIIRPGDIYEVTLFGIKDYLAKGRIGLDGIASLPLAGEIRLGGLDIPEAEHVIAQSLQTRDIVLDPQVNFVVTDSPSQTVSVSGELNKPGDFPAFGHHTLYDYIAKAEGMKTTAAHTVVLIRPGLSEPIQLPLGPDVAQSAYANIPIFAGDSIVIPSVGVVYVVGALKMQGAYPLKTNSRTTVLQAIAEAQGVGFEASLDSSVIVRSTAAGTVEIPVRVRHIMQGKEADVVLMANDILLIPTNQMRAAIKGGAANLAGSLVSAFLYNR